MTTRIRCENKEVINNRRDLENLNSNKLLNRFIKMSAISISACFYLYFSMSYALPTVGHVTGGQATITTSPNSVQVVQGSQKAIIDWNSFNISPHEKVNFQQPNSHSIALNRIDPAQGTSQIAGRLTANGQVWLINPAGILFTSTSRVDVGGILATTANITNSDFMQGNYRFLQDNAWNGMIINNGRISVSDEGIAALVAPGVENNGVIQANLGKVILASGNQYTVDFYGDTLIQFGLDSRVTSPPQRPNGSIPKALVNNNGKIIANGGTVLIMAKTAKNVLDNAINMKGIIVAKAIKQEGGIIILTGDQGKVNISGKMLATGNKNGQKGGKINITGDEIIVRNATIDASGYSGGGEILIGGDYQGKNLNIQNATFTSINNGTVIKANSTYQGNGGKVIIWADNSTYFNGKILATGGKISGNGGFVETSGKGFLSALGSVDASSPHGFAGMWLLDPANVTISSGSTANGSFDGGNPNTFTTTASTAIANVATINAALNGGTSVTILTTPGGGQAGTITLSAGAGNEINKTAGGSATLTLNASDSITLNNTISSSSNALNVSLISGNALSINNAITTNGGNFSSVSQNATTLASTINTGSGTVTMTANNDGAGTNNFTMNAGSSITTTNTTASAVSITVNTAAGGAGAAALRDITTGTGGTLTVTTDTGNNTTGGNITTPSGTLSIGNLIFTTPAAITLTGAVSASGALNFHANTDGVGGQDFVMNAASSITTTDNTANAVLIKVNNTAGGTGVATLRDITIGSGGTITVMTDTGGNITGSDITQPSGTLNSGSGNIVLTVPQITGNNIGTSATPIQTKSNTLSASAGSSGIFITNTGTSGLDLTSLITAGSFTLTSTASSSITNSGTITVGGTATFDLGATQDITVNNAANDFNAVAITSANNVFLTDTNALVLNASTVNGDLHLTTNGSITQAGAITANGTTTLNAGSGNNITLTTAANNFNSVGITSGNNVSLRDTNAIDLAASTINGTFTLTAAGAITDSGNINVTGATTITAGAANNITLNSAGNDFSSIAISTGNNVTLVDANSLTLAASTISGDFNVTTQGALTQSGTINASVTGKTATFSAGAANNITLDTATNNFATVAIGSALNATLYDTNALNMELVSINGTLTLTAEGAITQSAALSGSSLIAKTLANAGAVITLNNTSNDFTSIDLRARNATDTSNTAGALAYSDTNGFDVAAANTTSTITFTAGNAINQSGSMTGTTLSAKTLNNLGAAINFNQTNTLTSINLEARNTTDTANTVGNVTYVDADGLAIVGINTAGTLTITTGGSISQTGALTVTGTPTFTVTAANSDILLASAANDFNMTPVITTSGAGTIRDFALRNLSASAVIPTIPISLRNATFLFDNASIVLPTLALSGALSAAATGNITQTGPLSITGTTTLSATSDISLDNTSNNFSTVAITNANNATLNDSNAITLGTSTVSNNLNITSGALTDSGIITVGGTTTLAAGTANITLNTAGNDFNIVAISNANNVILRDANALVLGASNITGTLGVTTSGAITQSSSLVINGTTTLTAGTTNNITLDNTNNDFSTVITPNANDVTLADTNSLTLGASSISGNLTVISGGALADSGNLVVSGTNGLTATTVGGITINSTNNQISHANLTNSGSGNIQLVSSVPLTITGLSQSGGGSVTLTNTGLLTIDDGVTVTSNNAAINLTTTDLSLSNTGAINSGTATTTITQNTPSGTLGLGSTAGTMTISGSELQRITANSLDLVAPSNGQILIDGITNANSANVNTLVLTATAGTTGSITFQNNDSSFKALLATADGNITVNSNAAPTTIAGDLTLSSGTNVILNQNLTAAGNLSLNQVLLNTDIALSGNGITLSTNVNGAYNLTLNAGNGTALIQGDIGNITPINNLDITGSTTIAANITTLGSQTYHSDVTLSANTTLTTTNNNIQFDAAIDRDTNARNLTMNTGSGNITITGNIGSGSNGALGAINFTNTATTSLVGTINAASLTVNANTITTHGLINTTGGNVNLATTSSVLPGVITIGTGGITTNGGAISVNAANPNNSTALYVNGVLDTTGGSGQGVLTIGGGIALNAAPILGSGNITLQGNGLDLTLGSLNFNNSIAFSINRYLILNGALTTSTSGANIYLTGGAANTGVGGVMITSTGSVSSAGSLTISGASLSGLSGANTNAAVEIQNGSALQASGNISITSTSSSDIYLGTDLTSGTGITLTGNTALTKNVNMNASSGTVALNKINGAYNLTVDAGTGNINFNNNVGDSTTLNILTITHANNVTNNAILNVHTFLQNAGTGTTNFGGGGMYATNATVITHTANGNIFTGSLALGVNNGRMSGSVDDITNVGVINKIQLLNSIQAGKVFFNGYDLAATTADRAEIPAVLISTTQTGQNSVILVNSIPNPITNEGNNTESDGCIAMSPEIQICGNY